MLEFELLAQGFYRADQLIISYDPTQRIAYTPEEGAWMDAYWHEQLQQAQKRDSRLFDAPLFRFVSIQTQTAEELHLLVGDTSYKEYVTTRHPSFARNHARQALSNALSVCSVIETSDNFILLDKRQGVDVYEGRYHVIGGFFERYLDMTAQQPDVFAAIRREIHEETGIQANDIQEQHCLCVVYDVATPHAELCFLTRLRIPLSEVLTRTAEDDEIKQLYPLRVTAESLRTFLLHQHGSISATGEPNLLRYGAWKFGETWYRELMQMLT